MEKTKNESAAAAKPAPTSKTTAKPDAAPANVAAKAKDAPKAGGKVAETGGPKGPEPTRYGDWERGGICVDF